MRLLPEPLARECHSQYPAYHHEGERSQTRIRYIVLHSAEDEDTPGSAKAVAQYFMTPASGGSSNLVVDDWSCYRCLADTIVPWGAPPLNQAGFHIEQSGRAAWTRKRWLLHRLEIRRAAYKAALTMHWYQIPARILNVEELVKDFYLPADVNIGHNPGPLKGGIVTHATISKAYGESSHTDPGSGYPLDLFLSLVQSYLKGMTVKL